MSYNRNNMYRKILYLINISLSIFIYPILFLKKKITRKEIWLFGAGNGYYENNIAHFHNYILTTIPESRNEVYFVTLSSKHIKNNEFKTLIRGRALTYAMSMIADYLIIDTCNSDISPGLHKLLKGLKVNVSHGFEGFKKLPSNYYANINAHIQCASSEKEKEIKVSMCGAVESTVFITGYPRFDSIPLNKVSKISKILYFPTWRSWLEHSSVEDSSHIDYISAVRNLLFNEDLKEYLKSENIFLYYKPHHKLNHLDLSDLDSNNIILLKPNDNLTDFIQTSDLLITDYSSVAWDFLYNNRKVIFYIFDIEKYIEEQGLYYDVREFNFFDYSMSSDGVISLLQKFNTEFTTNSQKLASDFFKFKDSKNCERLMSLIHENKL